jgi:hypothetical protein
MSEAQRLANEFRPTMPREVMQLWGNDASAELRRLAPMEAELKKAKDALQFVERWANHHGTKPHVTPQEALSCIQHYPSIEEITKSYADGVVPNTSDPFAELQRTREELAALRASLGEPVGWLHECRKKPELRVLSFKKDHPNLKSKGYIASPAYAIKDPK